MKKLLALLVLSVSLVGCGSNKDNKDIEVEQTETVVEESIDNEEPTDFSIVVKDKYYNLDVKAKDIIETACSRGFTVEKLVGDNKLDYGEVVFDYDTALYSISDYIDSNGTPMLMPFNGFYINVDDVEENLFTPFYLFVNDSDKPISIEDARCIGVVASGGNKISNLLNVENMGTISDVSSLENAGNYVDTKSYMVNSEYFVMNFDNGDTSILLDTKYMKDFGNARIVHFSTDDYNLVSEIFTKLNSDGIDYYGMYTKTDDEQIIKNDFESDRIISFAFEDKVVTITDLGDNFNFYTGDSAIKYTDGSYFTGEGVRFEYYNKSFKFYGSHSTGVERVDSPFRLSVDNEAISVYEDSDNYTVYASDLHSGSILYLKPLNLYLHLFEVSDIDDVKELADWALQNITVESATR